MIRHTLFYFIISISTLFGADFIPCSPTQIFTNYQLSTNDRSQKLVLKRAVKDYIEAYRNLTNALGIMHNPNVSLRPKQHVGAIALNQFHQARKSIRQIYLAEKAAEESPSSQNDKDEVGRSRNCNPDVINHKVHPSPPLWAHQAMQIPDLLTRHVIGPQLCTVTLTCEKDFHQRVKGPDPVYTSDQLSDYNSKLLKTALRDMKHYYFKINTTHHQLRVERMPAAPTLCVRSSSYKCSKFMLTHFYQSWINETAILKQQHSHLKNFDALNALNGLRVISFGDDAVSPKVESFDVYGYPEGWRFQDHLDKQAMYDFNKWQNFELEAQKKNEAKELEPFHYDPSKSDFWYPIEWENKFNFTWYATNLVGNHHILRPFPIGVADHNEHYLRSTRRKFVESFLASSSSSSSSPIAAVTDLETIKRTNNNKNNKKKQQQEYSMIKKKHLLLVNFKAKGGPYGSTERAALYRLAVLGSMTSQQALEQYVYPLSPHLIIYNNYNKAPPDKEFMVIKPPSRLSPQKLIEKFDRFTVAEEKVKKSRELEALNHPTTTMFDDMFQDAISGGIEYATIVEKIVKQFEEHEAKAWLWADIEPRYMSSKWDDEDLETYFRELASYHFVLSPRGNGLDCFRTWEALAVGTVGELF
jgi:hypothetical protein